MSNKAGETAALLYQFKVGDLVSHSENARSLGRITQVLSDGWVRVVWRFSTGTHHSHNLRPIEKAPYPNW